MSKISDFLPDDIIGGRSSSGERKIRKRSNRSQNKSGISFFKNLDIEED